MMMEQELEQDKETLAALEEMLEREREKWGRLLAEIAEQDKETLAALEEMLEREREKWGRLLAAMNLGQGT